jgi:L-alanine-DL-glutamate epimerase-like enolase superfamily enzyme
LLEQPLPPGKDEALENLCYPVPVCADESCQSSADLEAVADRYDAINIKLDKCGGLTDALVIREWCQQNKKLIMVGNMLGSSLAMAPALVVAQGADFVDLDGPMWQRADVAPALTIDQGAIFPPQPDLWG